MRALNGEIIDRLETGSAFCAPASSALAMAESYLNDKRRLMPCAVWIDGLYGLDGLYVSVPVVIGAGGVEKVVEIRLSESAKAGLGVSVSAVRELVTACRALEPALG